MEGKSMAVVYLAFDVKFYGEDLGEIQELERRLLEYAKSIHPNLRFDSDVEVEAYEHAGEEST